MLDFNPAVDKLVQGITWVFSATFLSAIVGRLMHHIRSVQMGRRKFWSMHLIWELPIAYGMAMMGDGLSEHLRLNPKESLALIAALAYMGPHGIETMWGILMVKFGKKDKCNDKK